MPALAALILSRMPASVFSVAPIGIAMSTEPVLGAKTPAVQVPRRTVRLPVPTTSVAAWNWPVALTADCAAERAVTETE
jgi:hypothetical protein